MGKVIDHEWEDMDVDRVEHVSTIPSVQIFRKEECTDGKFVELEKPDLIKLCKVMGVQPQDLE